MGLGEFDELFLFCQIFYGVVRKSRGSGGDFDVEGEIRV
jgi:hypothetical protein